MAASLETIAETIERFIRRRSGEGQRPPVPRDANLFARGFSKPVGIVRLSALVESRFGVTVAIDSLMMDGFTAIKESAG